MPRDVFEILLEIYGEARINLPNQFVESVDIAGQDRIESFEFDLSEYINF